jgi:hypothetical protein
MSLVDSTYESELTAQGQYGAQTLVFVKRLLKKILYVDVSLGGFVVSGQVKNGDGTNHAALTSVSVRLTGLSTMAGTTGTVLAGEGTGEIIIQTLSNGTFSITLTLGLGATEIGVVVTPAGGLPTIVVI